MTETGVDWCGVDWVVTATVKYWNACPSRFEGVPTSASHSWSKATGHKNLSFTKMLIWLTAPTTKRARALKVTNFAGCLTDMLECEKLCAYLHIHLVGEGIADIQFSWRMAVMAWGSNNPHSAAAKVASFCDTVRSASLLQAFIYSPTSSASSWQTRSNKR